MKKILIAVLSLSIMACHATKPLSNHQENPELIKKYSDADEIQAKAAMDKKCSMSRSANKMSMDSIIAFNASVDQDMREGLGLSERTKRLDYEMKAANPPSVQALNGECKLAEERYTQIIAARSAASDAYQPVTPVRAAPLTCVSSKSGTTVYTTCN